MSCVFINSKRNLNKMIQSYTFENVDIENVICGSKCKILSFIFTKNNEPIININQDHNKTQKNILTKIKNPSKNETKHDKVDRNQNHHDKSISIC